MWSDTTGNKPAQISDFVAVFGNIVRILLAVGAIALFILLLSGGLKYLTSGGDPKAVDSAQKTITYAIGGLVVLVLSYLILLLISQITGVKQILQFNIGS